MYYFQIHNFYCKHYINKKLSMPSQTGNKNVLKTFKTFIMRNFNDGNSHQTHESCEEKNSKNH